jgi:predicted secreted protein
MAEFVAKNGTAGLFRGSGSPLAYTKITGVKSFNPGAITAPELDVTDFDSPAGYTETVAGLKSASAGTIVLNFDPGDTHQEAIRSAFIAGSVVKLKALYDDREALFDVIITGFDTPQQVGAVAELTVTIKLTGAITWQAVA